MTLIAVREIFKLRAEYSMKLNKAFQGIITSGAISRIFTRGLVALIKLH